MVKYKVVLARDDGRVVSEYSIGFDKEYDDSREDEYFEEFDQTVFVEEVDRLGTTTILSDLGTEICRDILVDQKVEYDIS